ncbi:MAG: GNAT family N-acetyltransferase [Oceanicoccus sp.]
MTNNNMTQPILLPAPHQRDWRDWKDAQPKFQSPDSRFELRRSSPEDFPEIYELLNSVFEHKRSQEEYDWIYEKNPYGKARCELIIEKSSGQIISTNARFPWPLAWGDRDMESSQGGDSATLTRLQRQGLVSLRIQFQQSHPWEDQQIRLSLPNQASRNASKKYDQPTAVDPAPFAKKILDWHNFLTTKGVPAYLAKVAAPAARLVTSPSRQKKGNLRIEPIRRFYQEHQTLSLSHSRSDGFWCPHGAEWMNWRYFSHPTREYLAHGLYSGDELQAFSVIRLDRDSAMLMELISPNIQLSQILLAEVERVALEAGAKTIDTYASKGWRQWPALKRQRYFMRPSNIYLSTRSNDHPEALLPENWQLLPGDSDVF